MRAERSRSEADRWYWRQALGSVPPNVRARVARAYRSSREGKGDGMMLTTLNDLQYAVRAVRKNLAFNAVVIGTLALGIGANTTVYSVVYGLILNPFPFPEPDRIVGVGTAYPGLGAGLGFFENLSPHEFIDIRDQAGTLERVVSWDMGNRQIDTDGPPENVASAFWWGDPLTTLGMSPHLGRGFSADEVERGDRVIMLSYRSWRNRFGADSSMVGRPLGVNGEPHVLVGIAPEGVNIYGTDLWMIMPVGPEVFPRNRRQFQVMARVREGASLSEVNTELEGLARRTEREYGAEYEEYAGWSMHAETWNNVASRRFRSGGFVMLGAVGFVLLLVCANTANILLARAQGRRREMVVRTALGAGRGRLVRQLLTESVVMATMGGFVGVGLAYLGILGVRAFFPAIGLNPAGSVELNLAVLAFTAAIALGAGLLFGLAPALQASRGGIAGALQAEVRTATAGRSRQRLQRGFVATEVALAFVLLAGGGLLANSFARMARVDPGFQAERVLTMRLTLPREEYEGPAVAAFFQELTERLRAVPGVRRAAAGTQYPPVSFSFRQVFFDGRTADPEATLPNVLATVVTPGYFETLGIPLVGGRTFGRRDAAGTPLVAVVNQVAADRHFPGENPVGRRLKLGAADADTPWWEIIGVVGATRNLALDQDPYPEVFAVHDQVGGSQNQLFLLLRSDAEPQALVGAVRDVVQDMDPDQPIYAVRTVEQTYRQAASTLRATTLVLGVFAAFALILAAVGIYSVVTFTVGARTQEIGVRVALGADGGRVRSLVVRQALLPVALGATVGLALAATLGGRLEQVLYEVTGTDPVTLSAVALLLVGVATVASWVPAWRASRMDPVEALRVE